MSVWVVVLALGLVLILLRLQYPSLEMFLEVYFRKPLSLQRSLPEACPDTFGPTPLYMEDPHPK